MSGPRLEIRHLQNFRILAEELNFTRAAQRAGMTQPSLSLLVSRMEDILETPLFERSRRHVRLTDAGEVLLSRTDSILRLMDEAINVTRETGSPRCPKIRIGYSVALQDLVTQLISKLLKETPSLEIQIKCTWSTDLEQQVADNILDCAFITCFSERADMKEIPLGQSKMVAYMQDNHPLSGRSEVSISDLKDEPIILFPEENASSIHDFLNKIFLAEGALPKLARRETEHMSILTLAANGSGIALLPQTLNVGIPPGLTAREVSSENTAWHLSFIQNRDGLNVHVRSLERIVIDNHKANLRID